MIQSEYLVELKRRRTITRSLTWKVALPVWELEMWIRKRLRNSPDPFSSPANSAGTKVGERLSKFLVSRLVPKAILRLVSKVSACGGVSASKLKWTPPRTEEVLADLQHERALQQHHGTN